MTIVEGSGSDQELMRLWGLIAELSEELNQNRSLAVSLYSQATNVKVSELSVMQSLGMDTCAESSYTYADGVRIAPV
jgi:hypothetical protein